MQRSPTCPSCCQNFAFKEFRPIGPQTPLLLECGHSFCEGCLSKLATGSTTLQCLVCQASTPLDPPGTNGIANLLPDIYILGLLSYNRRIALQSDPKRIPGGSVLRFAGIDGLNSCSPAPSPESNGARAEADQHPPCEECDDKPPTCHCKTCDILVCEECFQKIHSSSKLLSKHRPIPITASASENSSESCSVHVDQVLEFYNNNLKKAVCSHCIISPQCKGHEIVSAKVKAGSIKENLVNAIDETQNTLRYLEASKQVLVAALPEASMEIRQVFEGIDEHFVSLHSNLLAKQINFLKEISTRLRSHADVTNMLQDTTLKTQTLNKMLQDCQTLLEHDVAVITKGEKLSDDLVSLTANSECCAVRSDAALPLVRFCPQSNPVVPLETASLVEFSSSPRFTMKALAHTPQSALEILTGQTAPSQNLDCLRLQQNEILHQSNATSFTSDICREAKMVILLKKSYEMVYVTHVVSPTDFCIQRCADKDRLQMTMNNLNKYCRQSSSRDDLIYSVAKGDLVCAQFITDNNWYRARVISDKPPYQPGAHATLDNGHCVEVLYIDYGNTEWLPIPRLRKLQPCFLEVPELAVPCSLVDIVPPGKNDSWPLMSVKAFNSMVGDRPLLMNIRGRSSGKLFVDLKKPDSDYLSDDQDERPISVRDSLIFLDCAHFLSPASAPGESKSLRKFKEIDLPPVAASFDIVVTLVEGIDHVMVQQLNSPVTGLQQKLVKLYTGKQKDSYKIAWPYKNLVCSAKFTEDQGWYRALVTAVHDDDTVDVVYVDFGNSEQVAFSDLRVLPDHLLALPKQAFELRLFNVAPLPHDATAAFIQEALEYFAVSVLSKPISAVVKEIDANGVICANLFDQSTNSPVSINEHLVERRYATWQSDRVATTGHLPSSRDDPGMAAASSKLLTCDVTFVPAPVPNGPTLVVGVHVDSNLDIYVQCPADGGAQFTKISEALNSKDGLQKASTPVGSTDELLIDAPCIARFDQDGTWYRASIARILDNNNVELDFVDFGNKETQDVSTIRMCQPFLQIPRLCLKLKLAGLALNVLDAETRQAVCKFLDFAVVNHDFTICIMDAADMEADITMKDGTSLKEAVLELDVMKATRALVADRQMSVRSEIDLPLYQNVCKRFPLPELGIRFDVMVTEVDMPNFIYIQRMPPADGEYFTDVDEETGTEAFEQIESLSRLSAQMNAPGYFGEQSMLSRVDEGTVAAGKYTDDDMWYRASVVGVLPGDDPAISVVYFDYGTKEVIPMCRLRYLSNELFELPAQAVKCRIAGIQPPEKMSGDAFNESRWPVKAMSALFRAVANKRLVAEILEYGPPVVVNLYDRCSVADSETGETVDVLIGQELADQELITFELENDVSFISWMEKSEATVEDCQSLDSSFVAESEDSLVMDNKNMLELPNTDD